MMNAPSTRGLVRVLVTRKDGHRQHYWVHTNRLASFTASHRARGNTVTVETTAPAKLALVTGLQASKEQSPEIPKWLTDPLNEETVPGGPIPARSLVSSAIREIRADPNFRVYSYVLDTTPKIYTDAVPTAAVVDGKFLAINPEYLERYILGALYEIREKEHREPTRDELRRRAIEMTKWLLVHEVKHIAHYHMQRQTLWNAKWREHAIQKLQAFYQKTYGVTLHPNSSVIRRALHTLHNLAEDMEINEELDSWFSSPPDREIGVHREKMSFVGEDMIYESIMSKMIDNIDKVKSFLPRPPKKKGRCKKGQCSSPGSGGNGSGDGAPSQEKMPPGVFGDPVDDEEDFIDPYGDRNNDVRPLDDELREKLKQELGLDDKGLDDWLREQKEESRKRDQHLRDAWGRQPGNIPGGVQAYLEQIGRSKVNWREKLRSLFSSLSRRYDWWRYGPGASHPADAALRKRRILLPRAVPSPHRPNYWVVVDVSGSVSVEELAQLITESKSIAQQLGATVTVVPTDVEVKGEMVLAPTTTEAEIKRQLEQWKIGGRTEMSKGVAYFKKKKSENPQLRVGGIIVLTDGHLTESDITKAYEHAREMNVPLVWGVVTTKHGGRSAVMEYHDKNPQGNAVEIDMEAK